MCGYLRHVAVCLKIASRDVERKLRTIKHALEYKQIIGYNLFYVVCDKHLIVVKLYLTLDVAVFV